MVSIWDIINSIISYIMSGECHCIFYCCNKNAFIIDQEELKHINI